MSGERFKRRKTLSGSGSCKSSYIYGFGEKDPLIIEQRLYMVRIQVMCEPIEEASELYMNAKGHYSNDGSNQELHYTQRFRMKLGANHSR